MAKTIEEILKELDEWVDEIPEERSVMVIAGKEAGDVTVRAKGMNGEVVTCLATAIETCPEVEEDVTKAMDIVKEYRKEKKQQEEDN